MNINKQSLFWGMLLIGGGALALAQQLGYVDPIPERTWMWIFALAALAALLSYALGGWKGWPWLFPIGVFGGLAVTMALTSTGTNSAAVGSPLFFGLLIPFVGAYLTDRSRHWWALIPGGVLLFLALTTLMVDRVAGEWVGSLLLFMLALAFLVVYLNNRARGWAALVAYVLGVLGIAPLMASGGENASYYGPVFLLAVALPFFLVYFQSAQRWWAILPAGVLTTLAVVAALAIGGLIRNESQGGYANAVLMSGLAVTFAVVWLRHARAWAMVLAVVLALMAVASAFFANHYQLLWPLAIILGGVYLLYSALRPKTV